MKKKAVLVLLAGMAAGFGLVGCSWDDELDTTEGADIFSEQGMTRIDELYSKMMNGEASADELRELASLYREKGLIAKERDVLEQSYMLYGEEADLTALADIWVNVSEENASVQDEINYLIANLDNADMRVEAVGQVTDDDFAKLLKPGIYTGNRNYFLATDDRTTSICVGYADNGTAVVRVWVEYADGRMVTIDYSNCVVKVFEGHTSDGQYTGEFTQWIMNEKTGDMTVEKGSIANGNLDGAYSASVYLGDGAKNARDIYAAKDEYSYTVYNGSFDGTGATTTEKINDASANALISGTDYASVSVYAYNEDKTACLYRGLTDSNANVYSLDNWGINVVPVYDKYDVAAAEENTSKVDVKVVNGRLYVYDGSRWADMGNVADVAAEDPFVKTEEEHTEPAIEEVAQSDEDVREVGNVVEEKKEADKDSSKDKNKDKNSTNKKQTATPTPAPAAPEQSSGGSSDSGSSGGSSDPAPAPAPAADPTPAPAPAEDPAPSGGDTDVEWTDDLL